MFKKNKDEVTLDSCLLNTSDRRINDLNNTINTLYESMASSRHVTDPPSIIENLLHDIAGQVNDLHYWHTSHVRGPASKAVLENALDRMQCPEVGCEKCIYHTVGGIEKCNTAKRITDYLIDNDIVSVKMPK